MKNVFKWIAILAMCAAVVYGGIVLIESITNKTIWDTTFSFERARVDLLNGEFIEGAVRSWTDFEDGDSVQVKINDKVYLTHISNVILISE